MAIEDLNAAPRCQHIYLDNQRCAAPALRNHCFCHWHQSRRDVLSQNNDFFPILDDANSVQLHLSQVLRKLMSQEITPYHASVAFKGLQIAFQVQNKVRIECCPDEAVTELTPAVEAERTLPDNPPVKENGGHSPVSDYFRNAPMSPSPDGPINHQFTSSPDLPMKKPPVPAVSLHEPVSLSPDEIAFAMDLLHVNQQQVVECVEQCRVNNPEYYPTLIDKFRKGATSRRTG